MNERMIPRRHDERGASLMLVIAFMVLMGAISAAVLSTTSSGIQERVALDQSRNRQYSADAGIETAVASARSLNGTCPSPTPANTPPSNVNGLPVHVNCNPLPPVFIVGSDGIPKVQNDLAFAACIGSAACIPATTVISAQVNFQVTASGAVTTFVQAWSVNG